MIGRTGEKRRDRMVSHPPEDQKPRDQADITDINLAFESNTLSLKCE